MFAFDGVVTNVNATMTLNSLDAPAETRGDFRYRDQPLNFDATIGTPRAMLTGAATPLTSGPELDADPAWSPDGRKLAFITDRDGAPNLYLHDPAAGTVGFDTLGRFESDGRDRHDHYLNGRAIQRAQMPDDVNAAALFLLTQGSGFITGQLLPVNGGFVLN